MEETSSTFLDGEIIGIRFSLAKHQAVCTASISDCPISHASQLSNPFLGLPLEFGKCESCGTAEPGKCEGHFGYIELPIPIYHPCHISELKRLLSQLCLKCLKLKKNKLQFKSNGVSQRLLSSCCEDASQVSIKEEKTTDGASYLKVKHPSKSVPDGFWNFLERYGYRYGDTSSRPLLASEVMEMLKRLTEVTKRKLVGKGFFSQDGYVLKYLPVPPNCLSVPDISDGVSVMSSDQSVTMLKKVLKQVEIIKSSRSGTPTFEAHEVEANDLQCAIDQYLQVRGTTKKTRGTDTRFGISKETETSSTKAWLEKMRTLFIRKGSGYSSRSVITGDSYKKVNEIGLPLEIAQRITFEERVSEHNMKYLQDLVDNKLCLTYKDGLSTYSLREGSKGHTFLKPGQVVHRRIMDGDIVFINRPPTTHKHSLQALSVYVHDDHTVKINPFICGPLSADFDGDCVHLFYPQSLAAKAEVLELFSVEKQLLSSHSGNLNLQLVADSLLSLKMLFQQYYLDKAASQQLAMFASSSLPQPAIFKAKSSGPKWTALQILQTALPESFDCHGERHLIVKSSVLKFDLTRDVVQSLTNEVLTSIFSEKGPKEVLNFLNTLQPLLMENLNSEGFSIGLEDFSFPLEVIVDIQKDLQEFAPLLRHLRSVYDEVLEKRLESDLKLVKVPASTFILKSSALGTLIDSKSESSMNKVVQQIGFLGMQLSDQGKFYTRTLVQDMASLFRTKYPFAADYPCGEHGLIKSGFFHGLDPYEEMVHSISSREVIVRSSRGLAEPGTLFKNLMAILRDVVICYDGTVRNVSSNSIVQFEYGSKKGSKAQNLFEAGEPVGVLAATAMSNPAYKAVLDSSPSSSSSWELMKEVLLCRVNFKNDLSDRRVILYLNDCCCGKKHCREHASFLVGNHLKKVSLKDAAVEFRIEYKGLQQLSENPDMNAGLTGHIYLNKDMLDKFNISMQDVYNKCEEAINSLRKKKKSGSVFKRTMLSFSECCSLEQPDGSKRSQNPCLMFYWQDANDSPLEKTSNILADIICPVLLQTIIKGDPLISSVNIKWIVPETTTWIRNPSNTQSGELVLDVVLEKAAVKESGDAWRTVLNSCLPVLHLIDTNRSIPYGIKQVQELLGISCAFEQAVQRLSTSVAMVTKGVLKEHLILLANSMTCAGNLVGFNIGGYKALSRSLNIQVPFTEATLYTPRRCFERAAEKCHMDKLTSIVASCSWGRHVTVGTGSRFELLWDTKEVKPQKASTDVYNLLQMVRKVPSGVLLDTGCLGADLDDMELDDENQDICPSPDQNSDFAKAVFEDSMEFQHSSDILPANDSTWDMIASKNADSNGGGGWDVAKTSDAASSKNDAWSGWGGVKSNANANLPSKTDADPSSGWARKDDGAQPGFNQVDTAGWGDKTMQKETLHSEPSAGWGKKVDVAGKAGSEFNNSRDWGFSKPDQSTGSQAWDAASAGGVSEGQPKWGKKTGVSSSKNHSESSGAWGNNSNVTVKSQSEFNQPLSAGWGDVASGKGPAEQETPDEWSAKAVKTGKDTLNTGGWGNSNKPNQSTGSQTWGAPSAGGVNDVQKGSVDSGASAGWSTKVAEAGKAETGWGSSKAAGWGTSSKPNQSTGSQAWGAPSAGGVNDVQKGSVDSGASAGWSTKVAEAGKTETGWGSSKPAGGGTSNKPNQSTGSQAWGAPTAGGVNDAQKGSLDSEASAGWSTKVAEAGKVETGWGSSKAAGWGAPSAGGVNDVQKGPVDSEASAGWSTKVAEAGKAETGWGSAKAAGWGTSNEQTTPTPASSTTWDSPSVANANENETPSQWGSHGGLSSKKNQSDNSQGWSSFGGGNGTGDWKIKKNFPARTPGITNDNSNAGGSFTPRPPRIDRYTTEEQPIFQEVEPIMQSIKRIMHLSGYNDGDKLLDEDHKYVLENVFAHHPEKDVKMGSGVDHFTINKHSKFQDTRCFYVVSTDGVPEDFSSRKCVENFVLGKYPAELAESFVSKFFRRNKDQNQEQRQNPAETQNPPEAQNPAETETQTEEQTQNPPEVVNIGEP